MYWQTRADDLVVKAMSGLLERNPLAAEGPRRRRRHRGHHAAGRPGPDPRPHGGAARGAAPVGARLRDRPHVRRRHDERHDRSPAPSPSAPTTSRSPAASSTWAATRWASTPTRTRASSPRSSSASDALDMGIDRRAHPRPLPRAHQGALRPLRPRSPAEARRRLRGGQASSRTSSRSRSQTPTGWGLATRDEAPRPETTMEGLAALRTPFRPARTGHRRQRLGPERRRDRQPARVARTPPSELGLPPKMRLVSFAFAGVEPEIMGIGPVPSTEKALRKAGLTIDDIGLFELNEAFAVQVLVAPRPLRHRRRRPARQRVGRRDRRRPPARLVRRPPDDPARPPVRGAPRGPLRPHRHVRRPRPGRQRHLGEPALHSRRKAART